MSILTKGNDVTGEEEITVENHDIDVKNIESNIDIDVKNIESNIDEEKTIVPKDVKPYVKKALLELRSKLETAIIGNKFLSEESEKSTKGKLRCCNEDACEIGCLGHLTLKEDMRDISLWGVPLLPSKGHEGTDFILLKFLRARDYKVSEAFELLRNSLKWRKEFNAEGLLEEEFEPDIENVAYFDSTDKEGNPLFYIIYGAFRDKDLYNKFFEGENKSDKFIRWRVQSMERGIQNLSFKDGGAQCLVHITDLKTSPGPAMKELRSATKKAMSLIQENYPEIILRNIIINVPFWYYAYHTVFSRMLTQRMRNKYVFARPSRVSKTLFKYIAPENIPVEYGGLKRGDDEEFTPEHQVSETTLKGGAVEIIQLPIMEPGVTVVWDITVVGSDVTYKEEFIPVDECSYKITMQEEKKMVGSVRSSFYINEPGQVNLTLTNGTFKKRKIFYRLKIKPTVPMYVFLK